MKLWLFFRFLVSIVLCFWSIYAPWWIWRHDALNDAINLTVNSSHAYRHDWCQFLPRFFHLDCSQMFFYHHTANCLLVGHMLKNFFWLSERRIYNVAWKGVNNWSILQPISEGRDFTPLLTRCSVSQHHNPFWQKWTVSKWSPENKYLNKSKNTVCHTKKAL